MARSAFGFEFPFRPTFSGTTPQDRTFRRLWPFHPREHWDEIEIVNGSAQRLTVLMNGELDYLPAGAVRKYSAADWGPITGYQVSAAASTNTNEITIYERAG